MHLKADFVVGFTVYLLSSVRDPRASVTGRLPFTAAISVEDYEKEIRTNTSKLTLYIGYSTIYRRHNI